MCRFLLVAVYRSKQVGNVKRDFISIYSENIPTVITNVFLVEIKCTFFKYLELNILILSINLNLKGEKKNQNSSHYHILNAYLIDLKKSKFKNKILKCD